ncbi:hypothetical protein GGF50DRAFT_62313, partial [Schizophyllum commune]
AGHLSPAIQSRASPEPEAEVELAFLAKDSLRNVPDELKDLSVLSSEGKYLVIGPPAIAHAYGDHSVPLELVMARHKRTKNKLAPHPCYIHRLPTEVLCAIFLMCGDSNKRFDYPRDEQTEPMKVYWSHGASFYIRETILIGSVCWRWYTVTRGCPQLWTMIDIPLPQPCDVAALKLSLEYSKDLPLTLRLNDYHYTPRAHRSIPACTQFMTLVAASACRWEEISMIIIHKPPTTHELVLPLLSLRHGAFTALKRAMLRFHGGDSHNTVAPRLWQLFYDSPVLQVAQWYHIPYLNPPPHTLLRITHVGASALRPEVIMEIFRSCPQLQVLQAVVRPAASIPVHPEREDGYLIPTVQPPIYMAHLRSLTLRGFHDWTHLFDGITAPNLRRLEIFISGVQAGPISGMLKRSSACLDMLALRWMYQGYNDEIVALLQSRELEQLKIFRYDPYDGIHREPDSFDFSPYLPSNLILFTRTYEEAEKTYRSLSD